MSARPRHVGYITGDLITELAAKGVHLAPIARVGWQRTGLTGAEIADALTRQGATSGAIVTGADRAHPHSHWEPAGRVLRVDLEYAHLPVLVRDLVIHELGHVLVTEEHGAPATLADDHGPLYLAAAVRLAGALGLPSPSAALVESWPMGQRPDGFYGPTVTTRPIP